MRVCLVADPHVLSAEPLLNRMGKAQGLAMVQVRAKGWSGRSLARLTRRILKRVKHEAPEVKVLVNGRLDVALATGAAGVHLPARGLAVARVKEMVPEEFLVGVSAHCGGDLERARAAGADYAFVGPVFPTLTHPGAPVLGREGLAAGLRQASSLPVWAIGGINGATAPQLAGLPLAGVAAIRGLLQGDDMGKAVAALSRVSTSRS